SFYTATIVWGDGSTGSGTVVSNGMGSYTISGTHTYAEEGPYQSTVIVSESDVNASTITAAGTATVLEGGLTLSTVSFSAAEEILFSGAVATLTDVGSTDPSASYTATINWGDGSSSTGTVAGSNGTYTISGSHFFGEDGAYSPFVTVFEGGAA